MSGEEKETIFKILATILHLGNVFFNQKRLPYHGLAGAEIGSDLEIKWASHLLQVGQGPSKGGLRASNPSKVKARMT